MQRYREFIELRSFMKKWKALGMTDDELWELESAIAKNPKAGQVIRGTDGVRKIRYARSGQGKRGGYRVLYVDIVIAEVIYLVEVYAKSEKEDLTRQEKQAMRRKVEKIRREEVRNNGQTL